MTNPHFTKIEQYRDVESLNYYRILREQGKTEAETLNIIAQRSRDDSRTPMQWDASENAGFTTGTPWIGIADNYKTINACLDERPFVVGETPWNFADFGTQQGPMRAGGNRKGLFTRDRKPKMAAHYFRQRWENFKK